MGPLGSVSEVVHAEAQAQPIQLALSTPAAPVQGLPALFVLTHTGTMSLPSPADLNPGNEAQAQPAASTLSLSLIEPSKTQFSVLAMQQTAGNLDPATLMGNEPAISNGAENLQPESDSLSHETRSLTARLEAAATGIGPVDPTSWISEKNEASVVPDWAGWLAVAGILSFVSSRASRWRQIHRRFCLAPLSWPGGKQTGWPRWRKTLARPHFALCRRHRSDNRDIKDAVVFATERV